MKQLDLSKQSEQTKRAQIPVKSPNVAQECREQKKREEDKNLVVASNNDLTIRTNDNILLTKLSEQVNKDERKMNENEMQNEPMEIVEDSNNRKTDLSIHEVIVNRMTLPSPVNRNLSTVNSSPSPQSPANDPRFYVCTSFATSTPRTILAHCEAKNLGSSFVTSPIAASPSISFKSSQSFQYHDYCLSEGEFDITLPSQSTPSDITAKITARAKEAAIFRQIEGDAFDEESFFNDTQVPLKLDLIADDDVVMLPM